MNRMKAWRLGVLMAAVGALSVSAINVQAAGKSELANKVRAQTSDKIVKTYCTDYDGDGVKEAFILTEKTEEEQSLWFSGKKGVKKVKTFMRLPSDSEGICKVGNRQKIFVMEGFGGGSGSWSYCFYVKEGKAYRVKHAGEGLTHLSGREFVIYPSAFDFDDTEGVMTGHTYKAYYLRWLGTKFKEYRGERITRRQLEKYQGADQYLNQVEQLGYTVGKIFYRKNGVININLQKKNKYSTSYENITLFVRGQKVSLKVLHKGSDLIERASYGGIYKAAGLR